MRSSVPRAAFSHSASVGHAPHPLRIADGLRPVYVRYRIVVVIRINPTRIVWLCAFSRIHTLPVLDVGHLGFHDPESVEIWTVCVGISSGMVVLPIVNGPAGTKT